MATSGPIFDRVLLSNDDGIDAPGIAILEQIAAKLAREVWVVAPAENQSGTSHSVSLHSPLRVTLRSERRFAVRGTPADCIALGVSHLMGKHRPDLILSGINRGTNVGVYTLFSGTIGAAMMGVALGVPAIALSQCYIDRQPIPWDTAQTLAEDVIRQLVAIGWSPDTCLNVNFPPFAAADTKPLKVTRQGHQGLTGLLQIVNGVDPRFIPYHWLNMHDHGKRGDRPAGEESEALREGHVTVTPVGLEHTHLAEMQRLQNKLGG